MDRRRWSCLGGHRGLAWEPQTSQRVRGCEAEGAGPAGGPGAKGQSPRPSGWAEPPGSSELGTPSPLPSPLQDPVGQP